MSEAAALQTQTAKAPARNSSSLLVQRKCACGGSSGLTGSCSDCERKKLLGKPLQTKLRINEPGDEYEQEADRVAEQVMRMPDPARQAEVSSSPTSPLVQRKVHANSAGLGTAPSIVHDVLSSPGQPLDASTRAFFEPRFRHDFAQVRVHADKQAVESARAVNALAYTVGNHVVVDPSQYNNDTPGGQRLLAHELTHVVQQSEARSSGQLARALAGRDDRIERRQVRKNNRRRRRLKRFLRRVERRVEHHAEMQSTRRRAQRATDILCLAQMGDSEFRLASPRIRSFLEELVIKQEGALPDLSACDMLREGEQQAPEMVEAPQIEPEDPAEELESEETELPQNQTSPPETTPTPQTPPRPTDTIRCGETIIDIELWRARILGAASEMAEREGVELQEFSDTARRGNLWGWIKGYVQFLCDHIHMITKVVIGVIAIANAIAAAVLAALGLLGLLALLAASIFDLFNAMMSGGLIALGIAAGVAAAATALAAWLYSRLPSPPGLPEQTEPSDEKTPEEEKPQEEDEKKKEKEKRQDLYCGDGDGYMPHTNVTMRHSNTRGLHVIANPLTRCRPKGEDRIKWGTIPAKTKGSKYYIFPHGWACIEYWDKRRKEETPTLNRYLGVDNEMHDWPPGRFLSDFFVRAHLLHGPSAAGERSLWGPGTEFWNIIIADGTINDAMQRQVEQGGFAAVQKIHEDQEVLYYEVQVTPWSQTQYPAPFFADTVTMTYGIYNFENLSEDSALDRASITKKSVKISHDAARVPPKCDSGVEGQRFIPEEEPHPTLIPPATTSEDGGGGAQFVLLSCNPSDRPNFLLAEWERGNLDDEFQRMEPSEFKYYNLEVAPPGPSEYKRQNLLVKDRLGRPFVGTVPVRFISLLPEDPAKPGAVPLAFVEMRGIPCLFDPSGSPVDLEPEADIDWPIGVRRTTPVLSSSSGLGAALAPSPVEPLY